MVASANGHPSVVRTLLKAGATVNTTSQVGYTLKSAIMFESMILSVMTLAYSETVQVDRPDLPFPATGLYVWSSLYMCMETYVCIRSYHHPQHQTTLTHC